MTETSPLTISVTRTEDTVTLRRQIIVNPTANRMSRCEKRANRFECNRFENHNKVSLTPVKTVKFQNTYILEVPGAAALPLLSCMSEKSSRFGSRRPPAALRCRKGGLCLIISSTLCKRQSDIYTDCTL